MACGNTRAAVFLDGGSARSGSLSSRSHVQELNLAFWRTAHWLSDERARQDSVIKKSRYFRQIEIFLHIFSQIRLTSRITLSTFDNSERCCGVGAASWDALIIPENSAVWRGRLRLSSQ